jgi:hypothetical protein
MNPSDLSLFIAVIGGIIWFGMGALELLIWAIKKSLAS